MLPREDMVSHMKKDSISHISLLAAENHCLSQQLVEKEKQTCLLTRQNAELEVKTNEKLQNVTSQLQTLKQELTQKISSQSHKLTELTSQSHLTLDRCVLILGKSGAGKSSIANHIVGYDPLLHDPPFRVFSSGLDSVSDKIESNVVEFTRGIITYKVTVVDTVGFFDTARLGGHDPIFNMIEEYFKAHVSEVNLILFVYKKGRFTFEERDVFSFIRSKCSADISHISALAVTCCENDTAEGRSQLVQQFLTYKTTRTIEGLRSKVV